MSETDNDKPKLGMRAPLGLKRTVETGKVKQSFSHGRSNTVVVEVKRRRVLGPQGTPEPTQAPAPEPVAATPAPAPARPAPRPPVSNETAQERQGRLLREAEDQRMHALEEARRREEGERQRAAEDERRRVEERARAEAEARAAAAAPAPTPEPTPAAEPTPAPAPAEIAASTPAA
ncbi:translation initiation factor IF-2 associated domain-containing protein, partial [Sphingomonas phyllosphaerae]|uniref:translation initiation factor IF-2 associated domain-containing protein n=1 Tax=Sphingomonas phyllosphaerae TaxID=257003 RepID=UPI00241351C1